MEAKERFTQENANELMKDCSPYKYAGYTFEQWLADNDGTHNCYVGWLGSWKENGYVDLLKKAYEELDGEIKVGTPCTIIYYSDRRGATVVEVEYFKSGKKKGMPKRVGVRENVSKCIDYYAGDWEVTDELEGEVQYYTYRENHTWVNEGGDTKDWGTKLVFGYRRTYEDPSF